MILAFKLFLFMWTTWGLSLLNGPVVEEVDFVGFVCSESGIINLRSYSAHPHMFYKCQAVMVPPHGSENHCIILRGTDGLFK